MITLSKRMQALADLVSPGTVFCDVGCDHGFLPIALLQEKKIRRAMALDINEGPLRSAQKHITEAGLEQQIETRLSDGLQEVRPGEVQSIMVAGMGGGLVIHILSESPEVVRQAKELILQPQSEVERVRRFLWQEGFTVVEENIVEEEEKFYPMMKVRYTKEVLPKPTEVQFAYGSLLLENRHPVLQRYLLKQQANGKKVLAQLQYANDTPEAADRKEEVVHDLQIMEQALTVFTRR